MKGEIMVFKELEHLSKDKNQVQALSKRQIEESLNELPGWKWDPNETDKITKEYSFSDFAEAMDFANMISKIANEEDHHPTLIVEWGKVSIVWTTHSANGVSENDIIMARNSDNIYQTKFK